MYPTTTTQHNYYAVDYSSGRQCLFLALLGPGVFNQEGDSSTSVYGVVLVYDIFNEEGVNSIVCEEYYDGCPTQRAECLPYRAG